MYYMSQAPPPREGPYHGGWEPGDRVHIYIYLCTHTYVCVHVIKVYTCVCLSRPLPLQARLPLLGIELKLDLMMAPSRMCLA